MKKSVLSRFDTRSLALFASLAMGSGLVAAQFTVGPGLSGPTPVKQATDPFRQVDTDGNGSISRQEALRAGTLARTFDTVDANKDGVLSRAEFEQSQKN